MTRKNALFGLAFAASFVVGCVAGAAGVLIRTIPRMAEMVAEANLTMASNEAYVRYRYATYPVAKAALLQYADRAKSFPPSDDTVGSEMAAFGIGLTYARLALAAERAANQPDAAAFMNRAKDAFSKQRRPYDEPQIRAAVERLDRTWDEGLAGLPTQKR